MTSRRFPLSARGAFLFAALGGCAASGGAPLVAPATLPEAVDLRPSFEAYGLPPRGQGARPTCSIFATVSAFEFAFARATGHGQRLSVEYANWAANAATGRTDDGDFFHCALAGYERFGIAAEPLFPYGPQFTGASPSPDGLVDAGRRSARDGAGLRVRWIRPIGGGPGLTDAQFDDVLHTLAQGFPVAAGAAHSRLLVGYRRDEAAPGGGVFSTIDSAIAGYAEVPFEFVRRHVCDAFVVDLGGVER